MSVGRIRYTFYKNASSCMWFNTRQQFGTSNMCMKKREKEQWTNIKEKWALPKEEWSSFFHYFAPEKGINVDIVHSLQKPINLSPKAIQQWYKRWSSAKAVFDQSFLEDRVAALGCELAAAHFIVYRGGRIRVKGSEEWITMDKGGYDNLPRHFTPGFFVDSIDASGTGLLYEGLECLGNLDYLQSLNLSNCPHIDDWCIDRICGQFSNTLKYLNISNCTSITGLGFAALARLKGLKSLDITGLHKIKDIQLLCLLLEDVIPNIEIIGVNYMEPPKYQDKIN